MWQACVRTQGEWCGQIDLRSLPLFLRLLSAVWSIVVLSLHVSVRWCGSPHAACHTMEVKSALPRATRARCRLTLLSTLLKFGEELTMDVVGRKVRR